MGVVGQPPEGLDAVPQDQGHGQQHGKADGRLALPAQQAGGGDGDAGARHARHQGENLQDAQPGGAEPAHMLDPAHGDAQLVANPQQHTAGDQHDRRAGRPHQPVRPLQQQPAGDGGGHGADQDMQQQIGAVIRLALGQTPQPDVHGPDVAPEIGHQRQQGARMGRHRQGRPPFRCPGKMGQRRQITGSTERQYLSQPLNQGHDQDFQERHSGAPRMRLPPYSTEARDSEGNRKGPKRYYNLTRLRTFL
ncbi:protein of unknown function [Magnetospirillum sp. XM-1]|nr:protein of unknown function [Magnetospirillum sp. XM-1]